MLPEKSIYAVEMRLKRILEAVAERICCPEAHRSVWRNWILEGAHRTFGSQTLDRAASQPISKAGRPAIHPRQNPLPVEKDLDRCRLPCSDSAIPSVGRIQTSYAVTTMQGRMTNPDLNLRYVPDLRLKCNLTSRYFTFSANISRKLTVRIPPEIQMARNPRCMERFPPIPAPIAKKKIIPK